MPLFIAGLILGGLSGGVTDALTANTALSISVGIGAMVLTWLGVATVIFIDE